jgi:hypothetical protein
MKCQAALLRRCGFAKLTLWALFINHYSEVFPQRESISLREEEIQVSATVVLGENYLNYQYLTMCVYQPMEVGGGDCSGGLKQVLWSRSRGAEIKLPPGAEKKLRIAAPAPAPFYLPQA